jgi:hypothetical protein
VAADSGVSQIIVVVEDGEQRRQEDLRARRCMLLIDTTRPPGRPGGTAEGDAEAKGYDVFHGEGTQRGVLRSGEPLLRVAAAKSVRVRDGRTQIADGPAVAVASGRKASPTSTRVEAVPVGGPAKGLRAADRGRYLRRSGIQVEDAEGADR